MTALFATVLLMASSAQPPAGAGLSVAWLRDGRVETRTSSGREVPADVPLGSTWKLFVYAFAVERGLNTPDYQCAMPPRDGDEYCCEPGQSIDRDRALVRSCGRFFDTHRLGIDRRAWRSFWAAHANQQAAWLLDLTNIRPETRVTVGQLLHALASVPGGARAAAEHALLPLVIDGYGRGAVAHFGGLLRAKTFTWDNPARKGESIGGAAGWMVDGTPVWFASTGSSHRVLVDHAAALARWLPAPRNGPDEEPCVAVNFFTRYPIREIDRLPSRERARPGALDGEFRVLFENGSAITFSSSGELTLDRDAARPRIRARLSLSEYVARVIDREADAGITEAARALAVVARTWTIQNAAFERGCYQVDDSSRMQRVKADAPTPEARGAALFTDGLVLHGASVRYHRDTASPGVMSWATAVQQANRQYSFDRILLAAFPEASLATVSGDQECRRMSAVDAWLRHAVPGWRRRLYSQPGFEPPDAFTVCSLDYGNPYADRARGRIYVRGVGTQEDRIAIAHEYVHLAFQFHANGSDETFVEALARALVE